MVLKSAPQISLLPGGPDAGNSAGHIGPQAQRCHYIKRSFRPLVVSPAIHCSSSTLTQLNS